MLSRRKTLLINARVNEIVDLEDPGSMQSSKKKLIVFGFVSSSAFPTVLGPLHLQKDEIVADG